MMMMSLIQFIESPAQENPEPTAGTVRAPLPGTLSFGGAGCESRLCSYPKSDRINQAAAGLISDLIQQHKLR